jgi:hypothetical protein
MKKGNNKNKNKKPAELKNASATTAPEIPAEPRQS